MKILVVDDDEISRDVLAATIARMPGNIEVVQANDGEEAWQRLTQETPPEVCCCDLYMPRLDGVGLLQRARADALLADLAFVMISSAADRTSVTQAAQAGAEGFVVKPYTAATVVRTIERVMREVRAREAEPLADVRRRLSMTNQQLLQLTQRLQGEFEQGARLDPLVLQRLRSGCVLLGMHRAAALIRRVEGAPGPQAEALVNEAARLNRQRMSALQAPAH